MFETHKVYQFGPAYFFFNLVKRRNEIHFDDLAKKDQFEKFIAERSKKLRKAKIPDFFDTEEILYDIPAQAFDDLTCIDRIIDDEGNGVTTEAGFQIDAGSSASDWLIFQMKLFHWLRVPSS